MPFDLSDAWAAHSQKHPHKAEDTSGGALLVQLDLPSDSSDRAASEQEFKSLARAAGITAEKAVHRFKLRQISPATLVGSGNLETLASAVAERQLPLAIFNNHLSPGQERNIERCLKCRVLGRTGLILDIFARRARSHTGRLQVELAQLQHLSARLQRGWSHLERQKGGVGLHGPGEAQLELDRRLIGKRMKKLKADLLKLRKQRHLGRQRRLRTRTPLVALVGYTNAGKSTLLNALTGAELPAANRLFETLDTSIRKWAIGMSQSVMLADTVGFICDLPHEVIEAFQATLEGIAEADLLLVVEDHSDPCWLDKRREVEGVLTTIGAADIPRLTVLNKIDGTGLEPGFTAGGGDTPLSLAISASKAWGLEDLRQQVVVRLAGNVRIRSLRLQPHQGALRSKLYDRGVVCSEQILPDGVVQLQVRLPDDEYEALQSAADSELAAN